MHTADLKFFIHIILKKSHLSSNWFWKKISNWAERKVRLQTFLSACLRDEVRAIHDQRQRSIYKLPQHTSHTTIVSSQNKQAASSMINIQIRLENMPNTLQIQT